MKNEESFFVVSAGSPDSSAAGKVLSTREGSLTRSAASILHSSFFIVISFFILHSSFLIAPLCGAEGPEFKYYRSIDEESVPVWDEYVPIIEKTDFKDKFNMGELSDGEWGWWYADSNPAYERFVRDAFWNPDVDYETFEYYTTREKLDKKNLILADTRSCPTKDTAECKEWLSRPRKIESLPEGKGYVPVVYKKTLTELEIEELLKNKDLKKEKLKRYRPGGPGRKVWAHDAELQDCPFDVLSECRIWQRKPVVSETVSNRTPSIAASRVDELITLARAGNTLTTDMPAAAPLVGRYKALSAASRACCTSGIVYNLEKSGASRGLVYKFLVDDANFYQFGERCLMITDDELDKYYANTSTAEVVADVRNGCLCRRREYFETLLAPFSQMAEASPGFAENPFNWKYTDGLRRTVTVSINRDVNVVLKQLENCPD
ncbi:MAG: hypothetical protein LBQ49_00305 [Rickettsiales bacterium]|jgi:hypothetical protein|nr:hypothetical protein [Rickettsiales bacterium]